MVNILFVCSGDTCRSPIASAIAKGKIKALNKKINVSSAGIFATAGTSVSGGAKRAIKALGYGTIRHKSIQLNFDILDKQTVVICASEKIKRQITDVYPKKEKIFSYKDYVAGEDIVDPYGKSDSEYIEVARYLEYVVGKVVDKVIKENNL